MSTSGFDREVEQELKRTKDEAAQLASSAAEAAKERGREAADSLKERAAERADQLASALESTAEDIESSDDGDTLAGYGRSMAEMMRRLAGGLRENEIEEFASQLAGYARRNPASFFAGSVALGFGVSRFLKATTTRSDYDYGYDEDDEEYLFEAEVDELDESELEAGAAPGATSAPHESDTEHWPEDRGRTQPGTGSATEHWSPAISAEPSAGNVGAESARDRGRITETRTERVETRGEEEIRRNEP